VLAVVAAAGCDAEKLQQQQKDFHFRAVLHVAALV
jgi:hypothetical protein